MKAYFDETNGLTSTSANHIANLAKEYAVTLEEELKNIQFVDASVFSIVGDKTFDLQKGIKEVDGIEKKLEIISQCHALEAWLREAIKAKTTMVDEFKESYSFEQYCKERNFEIPIRPSRNKVFTAIELLEDLPIKTRVEYLTLQAKCAVYGKFIHRDGVLNNQRKDLVNKINRPNITNGTGRDMTVYSYSPSISLETIDKLFFELQNKHRETQAQLNAICYNAEKDFNLANNKADEEFKLAYQEYMDRITPLNTDYAAYVRSESNRLSSMKIIIPEKLMNIYNLISNLGKQKGK